MGDVGNTTYYIAHLETAMILFDLLLCVFMHLQKRDRTEVNRRFQMLVYILTAGTIIDVLACYAINYEEMVPVLVMRPLRAANGIAAALVCYLLFQYVLSFAQIKVNQVKKIVAVMPLVFCVAFWIMNPINGLILSYPEGSHAVRGPLFMTAHYYLPLFYILTACAVTIFYHRRYERVQLLALAGNLVFIVLLFLVQMFYVPHLMITYYIGSVGVFTMFFAMETPAYDRLILTMNHLEKARAHADLSAAQAIAANRSKSIFLAGMSREIRTPITSIISLDDLIMQKAHDGRIRKYASDLHDAGVHLLGIVDDILIYSRIEADTEEIVPEPYETRAFLDSICSEVYPATRKKDLSLTISASDTMPERLTGDLPHLMQIVRNLAGNAIKYTEHGGVNINVSMQPAPGEERDLVISVSDTGVGIREEDIPILFDSFTRVNLRKHRTIAGTGLGLAITKQLTKRMGGEITVKSAPQKGSTFTVRLPQKVTDATPIGSYDPSTLYQTLERDIQSEQGAVGAEYAERFGGKRILVIDDTIVNRTLIRSLLQNAGAKADVGTSGSACITLAEKTAYDLILLDHKMPGKDGVETLRELNERRQREESFASRTTPVVAITDEDSREVQRYLLQQGFAASLIKPVEAAMLFDTVHRVLTKPSA